MDTKTINSTEVDNMEKGIVHAKILIHAYQAISILSVNDFITGDECKLLKRRLGHYMIRYKISDLSIIKELDGLV